jgi:hypothetical protein
LDTGAGVIGALVTGAADLTGAAVTGSDGADDCEGVEVDGLADGEGDGAGDSVGELLSTMVGMWETDGETEATLEGNIEGLVVVLGDPDGTSDGDGLGWVVSVGNTDADGAGETVGSKVGEGGLPENPSKKRSKIGEAVTASGDAVIDTVGVAFGRFGSGIVGTTGSLTNPERKTDAAGAVVTEPEFMGALLAMSRVSLLDWGASGGGCEPAPDNAGSDGMTVPAFSLVEGLIAGTRLPGVRLCPMLGAGGSTGDKLSTVRSKVARFRPRRRDVDPFAVEAKRVRPKTA